ncbi:hypothetical protein ACFR9U_18630 [Halorientalis brevis]|uniref:Uncharacterized protein n=1 Tax=Halorientalis brevis TaxID=1126241 RepID=A0ABD6CHC4_9EURY|nr:hypothetical protein [Halorientalis brevis]
MSPTDLLTVVMVALTLLWVTDLFLESARTHTRVETCQTPDEDVDV